MPSTNIPRHSEPTSLHMTSPGLQLDPICTDASTTIGGGGWLSATPHPQHSHDLHDVLFLRWDHKYWESTHGRSGRVAFTLLQVSINILELAAALLALIKWGALLRDSVVSFDIDNTATLSWRIRTRAKESPADRLLKIYSMDRMASGIQLAPFDLDTLTGLLCSYVYSLFQFKQSRHPDDQNLVVLSGAARYNSTWWKAIVDAVHQYPEAFRANIASYDIAWSPT